MLEWDILNYLKKWRTNLRATNNDYKDAKDNVDHHILLTGNLICFVCYEHVRSYPLHNFAVKIRK